MCLFIPPTPPSLLHPDVPLGAPLETQTGWNRPETLRAAAVFQLGSFLFFHGHVWRPERGHPAVFSVAIFPGGLHDLIGYTTSNGIWNGASNACSMNKAMARTPIGWDIGPTSLVTGTAPPGRQLMFLWNLCSFCSLRSFLIEHLNSISSIVTLPLFQDSSYSTLW